MKPLKVKLETRKGKRGIPLVALGRVAHETRKFLEMVCADMGIVADIKEWIAENFENASVDFDCTSVGLLAEPSRSKANRALSCVMGNDFRDDEINVLITRRTRLQYSRIVEPFAADEQVAFGLYENDADDVPSRWFFLSKSNALSIEAENPTGRVYHGEIQGIIHALYKESSNPKLVVRQLSSGELVDCFFNTSMYQGAIQVLEEKDAVVFVEGEVTESVETGHPERIEVSDFRLAPHFNLQEFTTLIGSLPNMTSGKSTHEFIEELRDHERD